MPVYVYKCKDCEEIFEARHGMSFDGQTCKVCQSADVFRLPQGSLIKETTPSAFSKPGKLVDEYIREVKHEIKKEKHKLRNEEL